MSRVLSASERTIDFSSPYTTDYEAMSDAEKKYRKLREMISRISFIIKNPIIHIPYLPSIYKGY